ncbi:hypothetical protein LCGC14_2082600 [marine sediment metagenome]|uniref:Uncharacterized protein n=1 Tax=marine sediment metagenome TaxID=412755 RepID=A0A0F9GTF9_9ZZZZ
MVICDFLLTEEAKEALLGYFFYEIWEDMGEEHRGG